MDGGPLRLAFLPQVGGRLISLRVHGSEVLWRNPAWLDENLSPVRPHRRWPRPDDTMASWLNVGGAKTWPAPQGWSGPQEWAGPPDEVLDSGDYAVEVRELDGGRVRVGLTSADDPRTGVRISRVFELAPDTLEFLQRSTFTNRSTSPVRWAVWEVVQVDTCAAEGQARGSFVVDTDGRPEVRELMAVTGHPVVEPSERQTIVPVQDVVAKLGFPGSTGRVEWRRPDGLRLSLSTSVRGDAEHPDDGCPVELWLQHPTARPIEALGGLHPDADLVEMEVLGPLETLHPGASTTLHTRWSTTPPTAATNAGARTDRRAPAGSHLRSLPPAALRPAALRERAT